MKDLSLPCHECQDRFLDNLEGALSPDEQSAFAQHIQTCGECAARYAEFAATWRAFDHVPKPSPDLDQRFAATLDAYRMGQDEGAPGGPRAITFWRTALAMAAAVAVAFLAGQQMERHANDQRLAAIESHLSDVKATTALTLLAQSSAAERVRGAELLAQLPADRPETLAALYDRVAVDPSINVRYAALESLDRYAQSPDVREKLIQLLRQSDSPLIRAELIKLLVKHDERSALPVLLRISEDESENATLRALARWSIQTMHHDQSSAI